jgi:DEAD/DEAH box helicase domain-containing protein
LLHLGISPNTHWSSFFAIELCGDVKRITTGVWCGSHFCQCPAPLKRICKLYGCSPQFILTSATLGNAGDFANTLIEARVKLISSDAPAGERLNLIINPPMIDTENWGSDAAAWWNLALWRVSYQASMQAILFSVSS